MIGAKETMFLSLQPFPRVIQIVEDRYRHLYVNRFPHECGVERHPCQEAKWCFFTCERLPNTDLNMETIESIRVHWRLNWVQLAMRGAKHLNLFLYFMLIYFWFVTAEIYLRFKKLRGSWPPDTLSFLCVLSCLLYVQLCDSSFNFHFRSSRYFHCSH